MVQPLPAGARKVIAAGAGRYLPSGHLVYIHNGTLFAEPFDITRLEATGPSVSVLEGVASNPSTGASQFAVSDTGTIVYLPGRNTGDPVPIQLVDREGKTTPLRAAPATWFSCFSLDGAGRDGHSRGQPGGRVGLGGRATRSRATLDPAEDRKLWTPDGRRIAT